MVGLNAGLFVGLSGVRAAQVGLSVTGNNIANVNTEGYSRQMADQTIAGLLNDGNVTVGRGTDVRGILGARDTVAERTLLEQESRTNYYSTVYQGMDTVEDLLNETEFSGINKAIGEFFGTWEAVSSRPDQVGARQELLASGEYLAGEIRQRDADLDDLQLRTNVEMEDIIEKVNQLTEKILDLNGQIYSSAQPSQDIIDQRNEQINELSELVGVDVYHFENNRLQVNIKDSNYLLVGTETRNQLRADINPANNNFNDITLVAESGTTVDVTNSIGSGQLGGKLHLRDTEIVSIRRDLDNLAAGLVTSVNALHTTGFDLNGTTGLRFFDPADPTAAGAPAPPTVDIDRWQGAASSISLSADLRITPADPASEYDPSKLSLAAVTGEPGNNGIAVQIADLRDSTSVIDEDGDGTADTGTFQGYYADALSKVGRKTNNARELLESNQLLRDQAQSRRDQTSKVNLDEEAVSLTQYQRAFEASSRYLGVINQLTADIISRLG